MEIRAPAGGTVAAVSRAVPRSALDLALFRAMRVATHRAVWSSIFATRLAVPFLVALRGM
jgi:hypothetical protein